MEQLTRLPDWQARLAAYISAVRRKPFKWGENDCGMFVAGAVEAMTGADLARGWRGYRSAATAQRKLADAGFADHVALAASLLPEAQRAMPGDVAAMPGEPGPSLGIVQGAGVYVMGLSGFGIVPLATALKVFRV